MSEHFYGNVQFPEWALRHLPEITIDYGMRLDILREGILLLEDEEAKDGEPWLAEELRKIDVPFDMQKAAYCEYPAELRWFRFLQNGETVERIAENGADRIEISEVLGWIEDGWSTATMRQHLLETLANNGPLLPPLEQITEAQWIEHARAVVATGKKALETLEKRAV